MPGTPSTTAGTTRAFHSRGDNRKAKGISAAEEDGLSRPQPVYSRNAKRQKARPDVDNL
jgi:hypothetical protein